MDWCCARAASRNCVFGTGPSLASDEGETSVLAPPSFLTGVSLKQVLPLAAGGAPVAVSSENHGAEREYTFASCRPELTDG